MNKKTQKGLVAALAATMGAGIVAPGVQAATVDPVAAAQQAVAKVEKERTKKSIDEARALVAKIQDAKIKADLTIKINKVMLDKYNKATAAVVKAKASKAQADVTAAYKLVTDLTNDDLTRKNALTGALNKVQKELYTQVDTLLAKADIKQADLNGARAIIKDMLNPWKAPRDKKYTELQAKAMTTARVAASKAVASKTQADADIAKALYADIATVTNNNSVKSWVEKTLKPIVDSIVVDETAKVESVSANNLKNITVTFNKAVDEATIKAANVKVYDGTTLLTGVTLNLLEDEKTLLISNNGTFTQNKEYRVVVENVEQKDSDVKVASYDSNVKVLDTILPNVESVNVLSPKTIEILFSEPIQTGTGAGQFPTSASVLTNIVQVDGINLYATPDVTKVVTGNKVTLTLNTALTAGAHKVKVNNLNDFANLPITAKEFDITLSTDTAAPEATAVKVLNKDKVKVTFNEPVDNATVQSNLANIKVNGTAISAAVAKDGGVSYELTLGTSLNLGAVVESTLEYKGIKDNYGNTVSTAKTIKFVAEDDIAAPIITNTVVNSDNSVDVTFSEDVTGFTGTTTVELYDKDSKKLANTVTVTRKTIDGTPSDNVYTITISGASSLSGGYSLKVLKDKVTDLSIRTNKFAETTLPVTLNDKVAPTVTKAEFVNEGTDFNSDADILDSKLTIYFSEAMDAVTLTNKSNYLIGGTPLADISGTVTLTPAADNKSVTITVNRATGASQLTFATSTDVRVIAVKDTAGNTLDSSQVNANLATAGAGSTSLIVPFAANPAFTTVVSKVEAIAKNQVKVYAASGYTITGIDANKIKFAENQNGSALVPGLQVTSVSLAADGKTAVLTLNNNLSSDRQIDGDDAGTTTANVSIYADADAITLSSGAKTAAALATGGYVAIDKIAPSLISVNPITVGADADEIRVTFDEALDLAAADTARLAGIANDLVVTINGTKLDVTAGDFAVVADNDNDATFAIQVLKNGITATDTVTVELVNGRYVVDAAGNTASAFAATNIKAGDMINEKADPTATLATAGVNNSATSLVVTFDEALYVNGVAVADGADVKSAFTLGGTTAGTTSVTSAIYNATAKTVTFTLASVDDADTLTHNADATKLTDATGNAYAAKVYTYSAATKWASN